MTTTAVKQDDTPWHILIPLLVGGLLGVAVFAFSTIYTIPSIIERLGDQATEPPPPDFVIVLGTMFQLTILTVFATWGGLTIAQKLNLDFAPILNRTVSDNRLLVGFISGVVAGLAMLAIHQLVFLPITGIPVNITAEMPSLLGVASAFLYGGITEELLMRLGLMSLFLWIGSQLARDEQGKPTETVFWVVNIIVTIIFALLHLPSAILIFDVEPSLIVITQALVLNSVSLLFGWLYWCKGIETAIVAHIGVHVGYTLVATFLL